MRKLLLSFFSLLCVGSLAYALDRQPNSDYHARREALARKVGGVVALLAPLEGQDAVYEFRQEDNFYYLSGVTTPGAGLLIVPATEAQGDSPARGYTEILFLPPRNLRLEKFTGPQLGADDPAAPKLTGFDRVEEMSKLPEEVAKSLANQRPVVYTEIPAPGNSIASEDLLGFLRHSNAMVFFQDVKDRKSTRLNSSHP
jgi:Xaa-Pro aminopeptidase